VGIKVNFASFLCSFRVWSSFGELSGRDCEVRNSLTQRNVDFRSLACQNFQSDPASYRQLIAAFLLAPFLLVPFLLAPFLSNPDEIRLISSSSPDFSLPLCFFHFSLCLAPPNSFQSRGSVTFQTAPLPTSSPQPPYPTPRVTPSLSKSKHQFPHPPPPNQDHHQRR